MTSQPVPPSWSKRCLWVSVVVGLAVAAILFWKWRHDVKTQLEARRPFVGTWRLELPADSNGPAMFHDKVFREDGTTHDRFWNPETGVVVRDVECQLWW